MCFYHHSGSLAKFNKIPVSYLLQWEAIKEAKKNDVVLITGKGAEEIMAIGEKRIPWNEKKVILEELEKM